MSVMEEQRDDKTLRNAEEEAEMLTEQDPLQQRRLSDAEIGAEENDSERREKKRYFQGLLTGIFFSFAICCLAYLIYAISVDHRNRRSISADSSADEYYSIVNETTISKLEVLQETIEQMYLNEIDLQAMEEGMYAGLLDALGDPYSVYYTAEELQQIYDKTEGIYYGIGAYIGLDTTTGYPYISRVIDNTPAAESELQAGDLIYEVEGESVYGMDTTEVVTRIKGEEGTVVHFTVARANGSGYEYIDIEITRAKISSPTVTFEMREDGIAYIEIVEFDDVTLDQFTEAMAMARGNGMRGLILDLRGNPGGNLLTVVAIARQMLPEGMVVYTEDKYGYREEYTCDGRRQLEVPLVVLVDGNSASASEILAGAIKDYGIGTLVGTRTFGKGIVQRIMQLTDGSAIKLTISKYYTPNGYNIHGTGIEPDVEVPFDAELYAADGTDNQLLEAERILRGLMGLQ